MMIVVVSAVYTMVTFNYKMKQIDHDYNYSLYIYYEIITTNNLWNPLKNPPRFKNFFSSSIVPTARATPNYILLLSWIVTKSCQFCI